VRSRVQRARTAGRSDRRTAKRRGWHDGNVDSNGSGGVLRPSCLPNANGDKNESHFNFHDPHPKDVKRSSEVKSSPANLEAGRWLEKTSGETQIHGRLEEFQTPDVEVRYARESEAVALRISDDGKGIFMLTVTALSVGIGEAGALPIIFDGPQYIVAMEKSDFLAIKILLMDKRTLRAVYSSTGLIPLGIVGESHVLECH
jgi:hypothetical protein